MSFNGQRWRELAKPCLGAFTLVACAGTDVTTTEWTHAEVDLNRAGQPPTLDEFAESVRVASAGDGADGYVLEGDIGVNYELLVRYYEAVFLGARDQSVEKSTGVHMQPLPGLEVWNALSDPMNIEFCFDQSWDVAPASALKAGTLGKILQMGQEWGRQARVRFEYRPLQDGSGCSVSGADLMVMAFSTSNQGSLPNTTKILGFPVSSGQLQSDAIYRHELGHTLGLIHEHLHSQAPSGIYGGCAQFSSASYGFPFPWAIYQDDLTSTFTPTSVMTSSFCTGGVPAQNLTQITYDDGLGLRTLYGPSPALIDAIW